MNIICLIRGHKEVWTQEAIRHDIAFDPLFIANYCWCDRCGKYLRLEIN